MVKDAKVDVVLQRIEEKIGEEINTVPQYVRRYGVNNIFQRVYAYLLGKKSSGEYIQLQATYGGALKVASVGAGLEKTEAKSGTATGTLSTAVSFSQVVSRVDIIAVDYDLYFYPSPDGVTFYDGIRCITGVRNVFDLSVKAFKVKRAEANDTDYEIVGMW